MSLYKRAANDEISAYLRDDSVIVLHGARQVGKTSILYYLRIIPALVLLTGRAMVKLLGTSGAESLEVAASIMTNMIKTYFFILTPPFSG